MKLTLEQRKTIRLDQLRTDVFKSLVYALLGVAVGRAIGLATKGIQHSLLVEVLVTLGLLSVPLLLAVGFYVLGLRRIQAMKEES